MKRRPILSLFLLTGFFISATARAEDTAANAAVQDRIDQLSRRLDAIEQKENDILAALADLKTEVQIVKVRATT